MQDIRRNTKKTNEESKKDLNKTPNNNNNSNKIKNPIEKPVKKGKSFAQKPPNEQAIAPNNNNNSEKPLPLSNCAHSQPNIPQKTLENAENLIESSKNMLQKAGSLVFFDENDVGEETKTQETSKNINGISENTTDIHSNIHNVITIPPNNSSNASKPIDFRIKTKKINNKLSHSIPSDEKIEEINKMPPERTKYFQLQESKTLKFIEKNKKSPLIK